MNLKHILAFAIMFLVLLNPIQAEDSTLAIYFSTGDSIYRIVEGHDTPELIASHVPTARMFSNNGHWLAYMDDDGLWITELLDWKPRLVLEEDRTKYGWMWTPDDIRFILSAASSFTAEGGSENVDSYAFNTQTGEVEKWDWGNCNRVARHRETLRIALICSPQEGEVVPNPAAIALYWGGEYSPYEQNLYELLLEEFSTFQPAIPFDWDQTGAGDHFVYLARNPEFSLDNLEADEPVTDIFWLQGNSPIRSIDSSEDNSPEQYLAVSVDRTMVTYNTSCNYRGPRSCLVIADLNDARTIHNFRQAFHMFSAYDIEWFPDNKRVAILGTVGTNYSTSYSIWIANVITGEVVEYPLGDPLSGICCINVVRQ